MASTDSANWPDSRGPTMNSAGPEMIPGPAYRFTQ